MRTAVFVIKFLLLGALFIVSNHDLHLKDSLERAEFFQIYSAWFGDLFDNAKTMTGYIVNLDWMPKNAPAAHLSVIETLLVDK